MPPGNVFFPVMAKSSPRYPKFQQTLYSPQQCLKTVRSQRLISPLARNMGVLQREERNWLYRYEALLVVFLSIFPWQGPQPDLNKLGTVSIAVKEVICKEYPSKIRVH